MVFGFSQRGFVEAHCDDGLIEIFAFKQGWHASFVMAELISAKHIAQVTYTAPANVEYRLGMILTERFHFGDQFRLLRLDLS